MKLTGVWDRAGYVEVAVEGPFVADELAVLFGTMKEAAERPDGACLLLDLTKIEGGASTIMRYKFGSGAVVLPSTVKIAVVLGENLHDPERFGEKVARNRGVWARVFLDRKLALEWLVGKA